MRTAYMVYNGMFALVMFKLLLNALIYSWRMIELQYAFYRVRALLFPRMSAVLTRVHTKRVHRLLCRS
jgi:hypothetical protein